MICYKCNGTGEYDIYNECPCCNGTGEIDITNEEWLKLMTTEELAGWIYRAMFYKSCQKDVEDGAYMQMMTKKDYIENWLREIHHDD